MSETHKAALAVGRAEGRAVRAYLEALESSHPKRGRKRTTESISARLEQISQELPVGNPLRRLQLAQEQVDLTAELAALGSEVTDIGALEEEFIQMAGAYAQRKRISYEAFRAVGVPAATLKKAAITRTH